MHVTALSSQCPPLVSTGRDHCLVLVGTIPVESHRENLVPLVTDFFGNQRRMLLRLMELSERTSAAECKEMRAASQPVGIFSSYTLMLADFCGHWFGISDNTSCSKLSRAVQITRLRISGHGNFTCSDSIDIIRAFRWITGH
jgi:GTP-dependent phosphoenolpyruvate carboxykinase